ncbi:MAG TPA: FecR domain-containing protein [Chitinophagaceae bacterium]|nr:FecR domain-containing protein [Chitinophagaceae bacterium]
MSNKSLEELIKGYLENNLTKEELTHFLALIKQEKNKAQLEQSIDELLASASFSVPVNLSRADVVFQKILDAGKAENENQAGHIVQMQEKIKVFSFVRVAAAIIVILVSAGTYFYLNNKTGKTFTVAHAETAPTGKKEIMPGSNKATLLLADNSEILLDDEKNGEVTRQGSSKLIKINGKLAYNSSSLNSNEVLYNTISTPRGGQYQVELADGTLVWLNAASSLHFPTAFAGKERRVEITGEAYFEVAKNKDKPFIVVVNGAEIQVFGTHFNVMAYNDESELTTTLLEGSVKFVSGTATSMLEPGQQSQLSKSGQLRLVSNVDLNAVVAWKNGLFHFENADIETVMKQLSRWYDIDLVYQDKNGLDYQNKKMGDLLHADIPRNTRLTDVLKALEIAGGARFQVEGKTIIIKK